MARTSPLKTLGELGQSPWLDFISREIIRNGELERMIERWSLRGVTSNPAIFEKAISAGHDYDETIQRLARAGDPAEAIYEVLAVEDVGAAADLFRRVYDQCHAGDGFVSLEVSPELAHETNATVAEARHLWQRLDRPNVMIKVPATDAGLPAIRTLIGEGINVNVTLLFALERYREVAEAYVAGLEDRAGRGEPIDGVSSVASFFLSRIDSLVDPQLAKIEEQGGARASKAASLRGEVAIASARGAWVIFQEVFGSPRFEALRKQGARPQRLLWASTSTKNPKYSDTKYVEPLVGPQTVNTMPLETLEAYDDHGQPALRLEEDLEGAKRVLDGLAEVGIDLREVTDQLVREGVDKFVEPFRKLMASLEEQRKGSLK